MTRSFWRDRSVLVTGATGFLGGWLVKDLLQEGARVVALIRDQTPRSMLVRDGLIDEIDTVHGSLSDLDVIRRTLHEYQVETVFHLAAQAIVGVAKADPLSTLEANVRGTWNVLEAARHAPVRQVLVASSDKAYGAAVTLPYDETHPMQGQFPYDVSKSCADLICRMYAVTYGMPICVTRCGNLFGGGDLNFSRTVPGVIQSTLRNERFVIRSDGKFIRDFIYVRDAADAYMRLAEQMAENPGLNGEAFNFSLGTRVTVLELVWKLLAMMGRVDLEPIIQNVASGEIREQALSPEKARRVLGWSPRFGLDGGLLETIAWYRDFFGADAAPAPPAEIPAAVLASLSN